MRGWKTWAILAIVGIAAGCTLQPTAPVALTPTLAPAQLQTALAGEPLQPTVEATLPTPDEAGYATLRMAIRWPKPKGYGVAAIPLSVQSLRLAILKADQELASQLVTRHAGVDTEQVSLRVKAVSGVVLSVKAYAETTPDPTSAVALAVGSSATFNLVRSQFSTVAVQLVPQFPPSVATMTSPYHGIDGNGDWRYYASEGDTLVLTGENFSRGATPSVYFNTTSTELFSPDPIKATSVTRISDTELRVKVPAQATTGNPLVEVDGIMTMAPTTLWVPTIAITAPPKQAYDITPADTRLVPDELGYTGTAVSKPIPGSTCTLTATVSWTVNTPDAYDVYGPPPSVSPAWDTTISAGVLQSVGQYATKFTPYPLNGQDFYGTSIFAKVGSLKSNEIKLMIGNVCKVYAGGCN